MQPENAGQYLSDLVAGYQASIVIFAANRLDLFSKIGSETDISPGRLAQLLGTEPEGTSRMANVLVSLGLLKKSPKGYSNTEMSLRFLNRNSPLYQGDIIRHHESLLLRWKDFGLVLKEGKQASAVPEVRDKDQLDAFIRGMANISVMSAVQLADALDLEGVHRILDLGGGPGIYLIEFLKRVQTATGVILDYEGPLEIAKEYIEQAGLTSRINLIAGDMLKTPMGSGYDLVILSNLIHSFSVSENRQLFRDVFQAMSSGGRFVVKDFPLNEDRSGPVFSTLFAINMYMGTQEGNAYTLTEWKEWLIDAGFNITQSFPLAKNSHVLVAKKK